MKLKTILVRPNGLKEVVSDIFNKCGDDTTQSARHIRRLARYDDLRAMSRTNSVHGRLWYFVDESNLLQSPQSGLDDLEALEYLLQE